MTSSPRVLALCGGVGGAKLALGLSHVVPGDSLAIVVNTGDDFDHLGLRICPDIDTVTYTLAGIVNPQTGWGRAEESGHFMAALGALGGEDWFYLGDKDLAVHIARTQRLAAGESLSEVTASIAERLGVSARILPMSNDVVTTVVNTPTGDLAFQHYFVRDLCEPVVSGFSFTGIANARPNAEMLALLAGDELDLVVICPSNPFVSVDPILTLPGVRQALRDTATPIIAISPIIGGAAVKGPTAKMMRELNLDVSPITVARHYRDILDGFVLDLRDAEVAPELEDIVAQVCVSETLMHSLDDKIALARRALAFAGTCQRR